MRIKCSVKITKLRQCYKDMIRRCEDVNHEYYHRYGGRGIKICDRWKESFEKFYEDLGENWILGKGKDALMLDRIDNDGDYSPENCQWLTRSQSAAKVNIDNPKNGQNNPMFGKTHFEETRRKISQSKKGHPWSDATREAMKGRNEGSKNPWFGGMNLETCVYCGKTCSHLNIKRWHNGKCKNAPK